MQKSQERVRISMEHQLRYHAADSGSTLRAAQRRHSGLRRIAVLQAGTPGDFLLTLPALTRLHTAYPQAEIVLLGRSWHAAFLSERPSPVQRVITIPPYKGISAEHKGVSAEHKGANAEREPTGNESMLAAFFVAMRREAFDVALQLHDSSSEANTFVLHLGARRTVGRCDEQSPKLDRWLPDNAFQHRLLCQLEIVKLLGINDAIVNNTSSNHAGSDERSLLPELTATSDDRRIAGTVLPPTKRPLALLHPGGIEARYRWSTRNFAAVGDYLAQRGLYVAVVGEQEERPLASEVGRQMRYPLHDLSGQLPLKGLVGLLARCRLVVTNESDLLHLSVALATPTVSLYWCLNHLQTGPLDRLHHLPHISWQLICPYCGRHTLREGCSHSAPLLDVISVDEVIASIDRLLQPTEGPSRPMQQPIS